MCVCVCVCVCVRARARACACVKEFLLSSLERETEISHGIHVFACSVSVFLLFFVVVVLFASASRQKLPGVKYKQ